MVAMENAVPCSSRALKEWSAGATAPAASISDTTSDSSQRRVAARTSGGDEPPPSVAVASEASGIPRMAPHRSVLSIVAWLEQPSREAEPARVAVGKPSSKSNSRSQKPQRTHYLGPAGPQPRARHGSTSTPTQVEEDSLTFLRYQEFFKQLSTVRALDDITEDLSKLTMEDIFERAEKSATSEPVFANLHRFVRQVVVQPLSSTGNVKLLNNKNQTESTRSFRALGSHANKLRSTTAPWDLGRARKGIIAEDKQCRVETASAEAQGSDSGSSESAALHHRPFTHFEQNELEVTTF